jgi:hypothetical protein
MKNGVMDRKSFLKSLGKADVELLDSVLMGGQRCRFKITML